MSVTLNDGQQSLLQTILNAAQNLESSVAGTSTVNLTNVTVTAFTPGYLGAYDTVTFTSADGQTNTTAQFMGLDSKFPHAPSSVPMNVTYGPAEPGGVYMVVSSWGFVASHMVNALLLSALPVAGNPQQIDLKFLEQGQVVDLIVLSNDPSLKTLVPSLTASYSFLYLPGAPVTVYQSTITTS